MNRLVKLALALACVTACSTSHPTPVDFDATADAAPPADASAPDGSPADAEPVDAGVLDSGPETPPVVPVVVSALEFRATGGAPRGTSAWAVAGSPLAQPNEARSTTFFGRFVQDACNPPGYGQNVSHPFALSAPATVHDAFFPECAGNFGPSVDANVTLNGRAQHLLRSEVAPSGTFQTFGLQGQNASGANAHILASYTEFNPRFALTEPDRMRPWSAPSNPVDPDKIRVAFRVRQSVTADLVEDPSTCQLQQALRFVVLNEKCSMASSPTFCQIELNFKTYNRGINAYTTFDSGSYFGDLAQGGLIAVVGPIGANGQVTRVGGTSAWTSWGTSTQLAPFADKTFQVELTWTQFQHLLMTVTAGNPERAFGTAWADRTSWVLLRAGYGQENYNRSATSRSFVEGAFDTLEALAIAW